MTLRNPDYGAEPVRKLRELHVLEITTIRGRGVDGRDPVREVRVYFDAETHEHLFTHDSWQTQEVLDALRLKKEASGG